MALAPPKPPSAAAPPKDLVRERLGMGPPPLQGKPWNVRMVARDAAGKHVCLSGRVSAAQIRNVALAHQAAIERRRTERKGEARRPTTHRRDPSPIKIHKRIEGEQNPKKMPLAGLHPRFGIFVRILSRILGYTLDGVCLPVSRMHGKQIVWATMLTIGIIILAGLLPGYYWLARFATRYSAFGDMQLLVWLGNVVSWVVPTFLWATGIIGVLGGIHFKTGRTYRAILKPWYDPEPAWRDEPVFRLGKVTKLLSDLYEGTIAFGGVGSGKTASFISPLLMQLFRKLNNPDPNAVDARFFALMLDVKGNFADLATYQCIQVGRPLSDIIFVDPDLDLYRYNPLDPYAADFADRGAATLAAVNRIMGNESKGDNVYWDQTSQNVIRYILKNLSIVRAKSRIGLDDVGRYARDDDRISALLKQAAAVLEVKRRNNLMSIDEYNEMLQAVAELKANWQKLDGRTKGILRTTVGNMLGPIPVNPRLQRIFCRDTNFSMRDVINDGKIVIFRSRSIDPQTARMLAVCLKRDFQHWTKMRVQRDNSLNTTRAGAFIADEFQEMITCGGEGDDSYFGLCREARVMCIVATQVRASLEVAVKNQDQLKMVLGSLCTKIFLKLSDKDTQELGAFHGGKYHREKERSTIHKGAIFGAITNPAGQKGGSDFTTTVDETLEDNFRPDDFARLRTVAKKNSLKGPWYSEAIIYNYSEKDPAKASWCVKTRLPHLYPNKDQVTLAALFFDDLLFAHNAIAKTERMFYAVAAAGNAARKKVELECESQRKMLEEKLRLRAAQGRDAQPASEASIVLQLSERVAQLERKMNSTRAALDEYERTEGVHGKDYAAIRATAMQARSDWVSLAPQWQIANNPGIQPIYAGNRQSTATLLGNRSRDEVVARAKGLGLPPRIDEGAGEALAANGPATGVSPKAGTPNAVDIQNSAIPGRGVEAAAAQPPGSSGASETPVTATEMELRIKKFFEDSAQPTSGHERQMLQHDQRFMGNLDAEYERRFPAPAAPPPPPPTPLIPPQMKMPPGSAEEKAAALEHFRQTNEEDYLG